MLRNILAKVQRSTCRSLGGAFILLCCNCLPHLRSQRSLQYGVGNKKIKAPVVMHWCLDGLIKWCHFCDKNKTKHPNLAMGNCLLRMTEPLKYVCWQKLKSPLLMRLYFLAILIILLNALPLSPESFSLLRNIWMYTFLQQSGLNKKLFTHFPITPQNQMKQGSLRRRALVINPREPCLKYLPFKQYLIPRSQCRWQRRVKKILHQQWGVSRVGLQIKRTAH